MTSCRADRAEVDVLIVGAGITGCAAAHELQARGVDYLLLEKNLQPGGLTRSVSLGDAQFDYTGHFLHLQHYATPAAIPYADLDDLDWQRVKRQSCVYLNGQLMPAPFQYNLHHLPGELRQLCVGGFRNRPRNDCPASFVDYLLSSFGQGICSTFLFPYNRKLMSCDLGSLTPESAGRFLPPPNSRMIEGGPQDEPFREYNSQFWYPTQSGIGLLAEGLGRGLTSMRLGCPVQGIDPVKRSVTTPIGEIHYRHMLSSIPLKDLCACIADDRLSGLGQGLSHNRVAAINIHANGRLPDQLSEAHWIYVPEPEYAFYRVGLHSNVARLVPEGAFSVCAEVAVLPGSGAGMPDIVAGVVSALDELGWVARGSIESVAANWIDCAYVHFTHDRQARTASIFDILSEYGIVPMGRYGAWDYTSMEDCIRQGIETAQVVASR